MSNNVLFVSHKEKLCGVHEFGYNIGQALKKSKKYRFRYIECSSKKELEKYLKIYKPICSIYNFQYDTLSWVNYKLTSSYSTPQIGLIHEITQNVSDSRTNNFFDFYIAPDPTLILKNPIVFKTGRLLLKNRLKPKHNKIPVIGSFGFASYNKNFDQLVKKVCYEFDEAIIKLNIPFARFGDEDGQLARKVILDCKKIVSKFPKIKLIYSHDFLDERKLLNFLNSNTINTFLYSDKRERGISSVIDFALSVKVPITISSTSNMFRHIQYAYPSIVLSNKNRFKDIIKNGTKPLEGFYNEWTESNIIWDYERIVDDAIKKLRKKAWYDYYFNLGSSFMRRKLHLKSQSILNNWTSNIQDYKDYILEYNRNPHFTSIKISKGKILYNRILNDEARMSYHKTTEALYKMLPESMKRKNRRANIQQSFILDTVLRLSKGRGTRILSVGCFEDTAYGALKQIGYDVTGIDPVLNYDLDTYMTKPSVKKNSFDIVFSTSVIEHVEDDLRFLKNIQSLVKKGGYIVITCDFKDGYKEGDLKPGCDLRFYTRERLNYLLSNLDNCVLVDAPHWDCEKPDFSWRNGSNKYTYTFASLVLQKIK